VIEFEMPVQLVEPVSVAFIGPAPRGRFEWCTSQPAVQRGMLLSA